MPETVRIDKWLWSVRLYKTRSKATQACKSGEVQMEHRPVKPSSEVGPGHIIFVRKEGITLKVKVLQPLEKRVGARWVEDYLQDLTPEEDYMELKTTRSTNFEHREPGLGRPSKKQRRQIEALKKYLK